MFKISLHKPVISDAKTVPIKKLIAIFAIVGVCLLCLAVGAFAGVQGKLPFLNKSASQTSKAQLKAIVEEVGKFVELPTGEEPTLATVTDKSKLTDQAFFAKAENGDQVLLYVQAKKAYLYRPSAKKLIDVTVLSLLDSENTATGSGKSPSPQTNSDSKTLTTPSPVATTSATDQRYSIAIYNGTTTEGATVTIADKLKTAPVKVALMVRSKAAKSDYAKTIVVDMTGKNAAAAQSLAEFLNGEVGSLPAGELTPSTDLNVIVGASSLQ